MTIHVQFFAQLKDIVGVPEISLDLNEGATIADLLKALYLGMPALRTWDQALLFGSGLEFVDRNHILRPEEEIAVMPPVQGG